MVQGGQFKKRNFQKMSKVFTFLCYKVLSTQISHSQGKNCHRQLETKNYIRKKSKNAYKKRKNENFEKPKNVFLSYVPRITQPKTQVPRPKSVVCGLLTARRTDGETDTKMITEDTLSEFQFCFLQPIIKDRSNMNKKDLVSPT